MDWSEYRIIARADQKFFPYGNSYISYSHTPPKCRCKAVFFCSHHEIVSMFDTYYKETTAICKFVLKIITTSFIMWQIFVKITVSVKALSLPKQLKLNVYYKTNLVISSCMYENEITWKTVNIANHILIISCSYYKRR